MEMILYNTKGDPLAYIASDYRDTIYLWDGHPVAYLYEEEHVYGINGRHLGWLKDEILYNNDGERVGFTFTTCPARIAKPPAKKKKAPLDEIRPRWKAPPWPKFGFKVAGQDLADLLKEGQVMAFEGETSEEASQD
ncbi:MAG: hypothetical protein PVG99_00980 [Desulfobacteraceae bacterium]|jgi:hypothetical protein